MYEVEGIFFDKNRGTPCRLEEQEEGSRGIMSRPKDTSPSEPLTRYYITYISSLRTCPTINQDAQGWTLGHVHSDRLS